MPLLSKSLFREVEELATPAEKHKWYMLVIVNLSSINYPDAIPEVWDHLSSHYLPLVTQEEQLLAARKIREALTKSLGIVGAARTGNSIRVLGKITPPELRDTVVFREKDDPTTATTRGLAMHASIYGANPEWTPSTTINACPDFAWVIKNLFYGRIFSFDEILSNKETPHIIISSLIGVDCQPQIKSHMIGMLANGISREDIEWTRSLCYRVAKELGVTFRFPPIEIPTLPVPQK